MALTATTALRLTTILSPACVESELGYLVIWSFNQIFLFENNKIKNSFINKYKYNLYMKYDFLTTPLNTKLVSLAKRYDLKLFILFGSRAKKTYSLNSDWDFAYLGNKNFSNYDEMNLFNDIMKILNYEKVDLINLKNPKNYLVAKNIFFEGILIYESEKRLFKEMKYNSWISYLDFKKYYDMQLQINQKELEAMV